MMDVTSVLTDVVGLWFGGVGLGAGLSVLGFLVGYAVSSLYNLVRRG